MASSINIAFITPRIQGLTHNIDIVIWRRAISLSASNKVRDFADGTNYIFVIFMLQLRYHHLEIIAEASPFYLMFFKNSRGYPELEPGIYFVLCRQNLSKVNYFLPSL